MGLKPSSVNRPICYLMIVDATIQISTYYNVIFSDLPWYSYSSGSWKMVFNIILKSSNLLLWTKIVQWLHQNESNLGQICKLAYF